MSGISKIDYLKKYTSQQGNNNNSTSNRLTKVSLKQNTTFLVDGDIDTLKNRNEEDEEDEQNREDEQPILVEQNNVFGLTAEQKKQLLQQGQIQIKRSQSGQWIKADDLNNNNNKNSNKLDTQKNISEMIKDNSNKNSDKSSSPERNKLKRRRRHDSSSDDDQQSNKNNEESEKKYKKIFSEALDIPNQKENLEGKNNKDNSEGDEKNNEKQSSNQDSDISVERKRGRNRVSNSNSSEGESKKAQKNTNSENQQQQQQQHQPIQFSLNLSKLQNTKTIYRDAQGKKIDINTQQSKTNKKEELLKKNLEQINKWSKGMVQKQELENYKQEVKKVSTQSFAQYNLSKEAELEMIKKVRFGDTMAKLISEDDEKAAQKQKEIFKEPKKPRLKCKFPGQPNRFGIEPGHLWDGVDRSNGFEDKYFQMQNNRQANEQIAHEKAMIDL